MWKINNNHPGHDVGNLWNIERSGSGFESIKLNNSDFQNVKHLVQNTRDDVLFLSWANFCNNKIAMKIYNWFENIQIYSAYDTIGLLSATVNYIRNNAKGKAEVVGLMRDVGIEFEDMDLAIKEIDINTALGSMIKKNARTNGKPLRSVDLKFKRKVYDETWQNYEIDDFSLEIESEGTRKLFEIAGPIISAIKNGNVVLIDEIDARLHPSLVRHLIMMFNSISGNPHNAQFVCNTHDVTLLEENIRRDQIYFIDKNTYGVSDMYCLSDFKGVRKDSKILKKYLLGVYGAIPKIDVLKTM